MKIRRCGAEDLAEWMRMRMALWPEIEDEADQEGDAMEFFRREDAAVIVAEREGDGGLGGFIEVGERAFADGCDTAPVAYVEGWFVDDDLRGRGVGRELIEAATRWARERGYREVGSDALLENIASQKAHEGVGFVEVERAVRYRRVL